MINRYLAGRVALGLTQKQVADLLKTSIRTVGRWERGEAVPPYDPFARIKQDMVDTKTVSYSDMDMRVKLTYRTWLPHMDKYPRVYKNKANYDYWHPYCLWDDLDPSVRRGYLPVLPEALRSHVLFRPDGSWVALVSILTTLEYQQAAAAARVMPEITSLSKQIEDSLLAEDS